MATKQQRPFVKAAETSTQPATSRVDVDKLLRRYGASAISTAEDIEKRQIVVTFVVPNTTQKNAPRVPVKLPVSVHAVYDALYGRPMRQQFVPPEQRPADKTWQAYVSVYDPKGYNAKKMEQAERVAWRNLVLWIDAALSAASAGMQTITEAFFAHAVVGAGGERMIEAIDAAQQQLGVGVQRLLAATAEEG